MVRSGAPVVLLAALACSFAGCLRFSSKVGANVGAARGAEGSTVAYLWAEPPGRESYPLFLYLDGSGCGSVTSVVGFMPPLLDLGLGVLLPEKRGVRVDDQGLICSDEFLRTNDRAQRVADALLVVRRARETLPRWDGRLIVAGASEGGAIAPEVALSYPSTIAVVALAGGGSSQADELLRLEQRKATSPPEREGRTARLKKTLDEIRRAPVHDRTWLGEDNTFKRWASFLDYAPIDFFVRLDVPVYVAHGARDEAVPIESADAIADAFSRAGKTNLTYRRYADLDHGWADPARRRQVERVMTDLLHWLRATTL